MTEQPLLIQQKALAFAKLHRRWFLCGFFALCVLIAPGIALPSIGWQILGVLTSLLLGAAALGHSPFVYGRLSSQQRLMLYGVSAAGLLFLVFFWIAGTSLAKSQAENAVRERLKDPDSARFGDFYLNSKTGKGCLVVNAKNSMGGYTGDQVAYIEKSQGQFEAVDIKEDSSLDTCINQTKPPEAAADPTPAEVDAAASAAIAQAAAAASS